MADDELAGLSREELLELVRRQQDELAAREPAIERRDEKIRELEAELTQLRRPVKTPENSSVPPSRRQKATRVERRRKLGPKRGHVDVSRVRSEPDLVVACRPRVCAGCGQELPQVGGRRTGRSQVIELPAFEPVVIEAWQYTVACEQCGEQAADVGPGARLSLGGARYRRRYPGDDSYRRSRIERSLALLCGRGPRRHRRCYLHTERLSRYVPSRSSALSPSCHLP